MDTLEYFNLVLTTSAIIIGLALAVVFYRNWSKYRMREFEFERMKLIEEVELKKKQSLIKEEQNLGAGSGGFIIIDLPDGQRSLFHDLLKGFEDFAKLKGYSISFSVDNSLSDKIGFKFTINDNGISVSTQKVRNDIKEYMDRVKNGDSLDELPTIISPQEHSLILTQMKNRISFLEHNYKLQKNSIEFYENMMKKLNSNGNGIHHQPTIFVQTGGTNQPQNYLANNSQGVTQGANIQDINTSIKIANSFKSRETQINEIIKLIELTKNDENNNDDSQIIIKNLTKVKDELEDEEKPDKLRIEKWLKSARQCFENSNFASETTKSGNKVFESFNL